MTTVQTISISRALDSLPDSSDPLRKYFSDPGQISPSGKMTYVFKRKNVSGSENRFYSVDLVDMRSETVLVQTVADNMKQ